jgi:hypothetical protein
MGGISRVEKGIPELAAEIKELQQKAAKASPFTALPIVREAAAKQAEFNLRISRYFERDNNLGGDL